jgi:zinc protease
MSAAQFLNSPYRLPVIGWRHEMEHYTTEDALTFYKRFYAPDKAVLVVGGDVTAAEVKVLAEKYFGPLPRHGIGPRERLQEPEPNAARRLSLSDERVRQPYLLRRYLAPSYRTTEAGATPDNAPYALSVLAEILGGGSAGRLYREMVVTRQTALSVGADYDGGAYDLDSFAFFGTPRQGGDMAALETALDQQIAKLLKDGVTDQEVADAKHRLEISAIKARDSVSGPTFIVAEALGKGRKLADLQAWPDRIEAVTQADVMKAARQVLRPENSVTGTLLR